MSSDTRTKRPSISTSSRGRYVPSLSHSRHSSSESDEETDTDTDTDTKPSNSKSSELKEFQEFQEFQRWKKNKYAAKAKGKAEDEEQLIGNKEEEDTDEESGTDSPPTKKREGKGSETESSDEEGAAAGSSGGGGPSSTLLTALGIGFLLLLLAVAVIYWWLNWGPGAGSSGSTPASTSISSNASSSPPTISSSGSNTDPFETTPTPSSTSSSTSSTSSSAGSYTLPGISKNKIGIGFLPEYAQLNNKVPWDGSQLTGQMDDLKASGAIFQPAWAGLTASDPSQGAAIASVMKQFTDEGIEVWLRFAHEVNWYQTDGTYEGDADDFKAGWAVVAAAVKDNPLVKMFFTPNVANLAQYQQFFPDDPTTVDIIGIDYYPKSGFDFVDTMKPFHDAYCLKATNGHQIIFAIGETGPGYNANIDQKLEWLAAITSEATKAAMPKMAGVSWFNYNKEENFYLYDSAGSSITTATKAWMTNDTVASGAVVP